MKKDIKTGIKGLSVSVVAFALGMLLLSTRFTQFIYECDVWVENIVIFVLAICLFGGFMGTIAFTIVIITVLCYEYHDKKVSKKIKRELPKGTEFCVSISNQDNKDIHKLLCENLKCTAVFDGNTVNLKFSLPEEVSLETDNLVWFYNNFDY